MYDSIISSEVQLGKVLSNADPIRKLSQLFELMGKNSVISNSFLVNVPIS